METTTTTPDTTATPALLVRAARALFHRGDDGGAPVNRNGEGSNKPDYGAVRALLARLDDGDAPTPTDAWALGRILAKYRRQIGELGLDLDGLDRVEAATWATLRADEPVRRARRASGADALPRASAPGWERAGAALDARPVPPRLALPPMADVLGPGGVIARALPGYEARPGQVALSQAIADAIAGDESVLGEAGTGSGKSLAYLIPAILSGRKTIVSTEGKALQDQLAKKDLPFLAHVLPHPFTFAVLKGLANYACRAKLDQGDGRLTGDAATWQRLDAWLRVTQSGDLAELDFPLDAETRAAITSTTDECTGRDCPFHATCYGQEARRAADQADVVVVNHTLLCLDAALRDRTHDGVSILPDRALIVVDEAHALEEVATNAFTEEISQWAVPALLRGRLPALAELDDETMRHARDANDAFFAYLGRDERPSRALVPTEDLQLLALAVQTPLRQLAKHAAATAQDHDDAPARQLERYTERLRDLADLFTDVLVSASDDEETHVLYVERSTSARGRETLTLKRAPVSVAPDLRRALWSRWPVVATSATLTAVDPATQRPSFAYCRERTGADATRTLVVESPFDYGRNGLLFLADPFLVPDPSLNQRFQDGSVEYFTRLAKVIEELLLASDGRAFVLFTSRRALAEVHRRIAHRLRWQVFVQGELGTQETVRRFREDGHAVLFGLRSFMTGVDVPGEALSLVVIDKLPFQAPDDPVYAARCDALNHAYNDKWAWFNRLAVPSATLLLKQAVGRLIRSTTDRGVVALLDPRLVTKRYGTGMLRCLPAMPQTRSPDAVRAFFAGGESVALDAAMTRQGGLF